MDVSSSTDIARTLQIDALKKAQDVQAQQVLKVLEGADKTAQETASTAKKTGLGNNLNIAG